MPVVCTFGMPGSGQVVRKARAICFKNASKKWRFFTPPRGDVLSSTSRPVRPPGSLSRLRNPGLRPGLRNPAPSATPRPSGRPPRLLVPPGTSGPAPPPGTETAPSRAAAARPWPGASFEPPGSGVNNKAEPRRGDQSSLFQSVAANC